MIDEKSENERCNLKGAGNLNDDFRKLLCSLSSKKFQNFKYLLIFPRNALGALDELSVLFFYWIRPLSMLVNECLTESLYVSIYLCMRGV